MLKIGGFQNECVARDYCSAELWTMLKAGWEDGEEKDLRDLRDQKDVRDGQRDEDQPTRGGLPVFILRGWSAGV